MRAVSTTTTVEIHTPLPRCNTSSIYFFLVCDSFEDVVPMT